jgi:hypothetical protein
MDSIRNSSARASLRKTGGPPPPRRGHSKTIKNLIYLLYKKTTPLGIIAVLRLNSSTSTVESSRTRLIDDDDDDADYDHRDGSLSNMRRKVTLDPGQLDDLLNFSDDESEMGEDEEPVFSRQGSLDSIISHGSSWNLNNNSSKDLTADNTPKQSPTMVKNKGHRRRHSLTVCETPTRVVISSQNVPSERRKPPNLATQISTISTVSTSSSRSSTPTTEPTTPTFDMSSKFDPGGRNSSEPLASDSMAQLQARLHAEFLQSVRFLF